MRSHTSGRGKRVKMVILKGIPRLLSPQLLSVLARMGHGDEIGACTPSGLQLHCSMPWTSPRVYTLHCTYQVASHDLPISCSTGRC